MLRPRCPRLRATLACAVIGLALAVPSGALASDAAATSDATRSALATERYWSTYDIDDSLPSPHRAAAKSGGGMSDAATVAIGAAVAVTLSAGACAFVLLHRRRSIKPV
jgi:hypothetical protein